MNITALTLTNFRQFNTLSLSFEKPWTIIVGKNAGGKSTILESLYMLSHGDSPWESNHNHLIKIHTQGNDETPYSELLKSTSRIEAIMEHDGEEHQIALSFSTNNGVTTKQYLVDGKPTTRNRFLSHFQSILFSPDLIDLLMFEPSQRRTFIDFYTAYLSPELREVFSNYRKVLRHRNTLLKSISAQRYQRYSRIEDDYDTLPRQTSTPSSQNQNGNSSMLSYWTNQLADLGTQILLNRLKLIDLINKETPNYPALITYASNIPFPSSVLTTPFPRSRIKDAFVQKLEQVEETEKAAGKTLAGPHRDDWSLTVNTMNINRYGSRGEKRIAISDIIFKINTIFSESFKQKPLMLLDDISSELDGDNINRVYEEKISPDQQTIITATSTSHIPRKILSKSHLIRL